MKIDQYGVWGHTDRPMFLRLPARVAGGLMEAKENGHEWDKKGNHVDLLNYHNTVQSILMFISEEGQNVFVQDNYVVEPEWLYYLPDGTK